MGEKKDLKKEAEKLHDEFFEQVDELCENCISLGRLQVKGNVVKTTFIIGMIPMAVMIVMTLSELSYEIHVAFKGIIYTALLSYILALILNMALFQFFDSKEHYETMKEINSKCRKKPKKEEAKK